MKCLAYYNGKIGLPEELTVPFNDRVHFFGDGVYDVTYARNHTPYTLDLHVNRLFSSASLLDMSVPMTKEELSTLICRLSAMVDDGEQFIYIQVTRGTQDRAHTYPVDITSNLWVMIRPQKVQDVYAKVQAVTAEDTRFYHCNIKTLNLLPAVMYSQQAKKLGVYETILYRKPDRVTECAHSNVHILRRDGVFQTAPLDNLILPGIARHNLIRACRALGIPVEEKPFTLAELFDAGEVIISSSGSFCIQCNEIDGRAVGGGCPDRLRALQDWLLNDYLTETGK